MVPLVSINDQEQNSFSLVIFPGLPGAILLAILSLISMWLCYPIISILIDDKFLAIQFTGLASSIAPLLLGLWFRRTQMETMYDRQTLYAPLTKPFALLLLGVIGISVGEVLIGLFTFAPLSRFFESLRFYSHNNQFHVDSIHIFHIVIEAVIAPFVEEFVWRGFILYGLLTHYSAPRAIIINILLFTALHGFGAQTPSQILVAFLLCVVFVSKRSVILCFVLHSLHNFFLISMDSDITGETILSATSKIMATKSFHNFEYWIVTVLGILFLSAGLHLLRKQSS